jgi:hypothetical protein
LGAGTGHTSGTLRDIGYRSAPQLTVPIGWHKYGRMLGIRTEWSMQRLEGTQLGGGFFLDGSPQSGYNLPGSVFDKEFRCAFDLLATIPTAADPNISVKDQFFSFNNEHPFDDRTHIIDRDLNVVHGPRFGLSLWDGLAIARLPPERRELLVADVGRAPSSKLLVGDVQGAEP